MHIIIGKDLHSLVIIIIVILILFQDIFGKLIPAYQNSTLKEFNEFFHSKYYLHPFALWARTPDLIKMRGYPVETHSVITGDGYVLEIHRIPYGIKKGKNQGYRRHRPAVLLQHGNFQSSIDWVLNDSADNCLGFILAGAGYDVFLGNFRGNPYSQKHLTLTKKHGQFWNFNQEDIANYDLPAMIDYILKLTKQSKLFYIGFSMGSTETLIMLSDRPEYNKKIKLAVMLGTTAFQHNSPLLKFGCAFNWFMENTQLFLGPIPVPHPIISNAINFYLPLICNARTLPIIPDICWLIWTIVFNFDGYQIPREKMSLLLSKIPTPSSSKVLIQVCQNVKSKSFSRYDYGLIGNLKVYNTFYPPAFNLSNVKAPVSIFYGEADNVDVIEDIMILVAHLPNLVQLHKIGHAKFNHIDVTYAVNANILLYQHVLKTMAKY